MFTPSTIITAKDNIRKPLRQDKSLSLERSLAPLWKLTYYRGMLLDWCRPIRRRRFSTVLRCLVIPLALTIFFYELFSLAVQLQRAINNPGKKFKDLVNQIARISFLLVIILTWLLFLIRRRRFLDFFQDWAKQESFTRAWTLDYSSIRRIFLTFNAVIYIYNVFLISFSIYLTATVDLNDFQDFLVLIDYLPKLLNYNFFSFVFRVKFVLWTLFIATFTTVADSVPAFVYYHAAKNIEAMEREIKLKVMNGECTDRLTQIKQIWHRFEEWQRLIRSADQLFGEIIILNHGTSFIIICCDVCSVLNYFKNQSSRNNGDSNNDDYFDAYGHITFIFFNTFRIVFGIFMMAKISKECDSLSTSLIHLSTSRYNLTDKEERFIMKTFVNRLQFGELVACPAGFYSITPSILLTMLSLIVTYNIIMLQT